MTPATVRGSGFMSRSRVISISLALCLLATAAGSQQKTPSRIIALRASRMLDVNGGRVVHDPVILIQDEKITAAGASLKIPSGAEVVDLGDATLLPGLIDCHTHLMARISDDPEGYGLTLLTKSQAFRALEGAADARVTLRAGFTAVRDVESEGAGYADVALRDAINQGLVEGPRMQVATRGIAAVGRYFPFDISPDLVDFPTGAQMISGPEEARRAAREQIGHGANLLKVYADWGVPTLTVDEIRPIVEEAHKARIKVAAHADSPDGIRNALTAGVDSIEHGHQADRSSFQLIKQKNAFWVPTIGYYFYAVDMAKSPQPHKHMEETLQRTRQNVSIAQELGVKIANGFDPSSAEAHGKNSHEIIAMTKLGLSSLEAIRAATINAAELMGWPDKVGSIEPGKYADVIAVSGDPLADIGELERVKFVMKSGAIVKNDFATH
jgi:imidazolonepropionase-like amidohydrolase